MAPGEQCQLGGRASASFNTPDRSCGHYHKSVYLQDDHQGVLGGAERVHVGDELIGGDQHHPEDKERSLLKDHIDQDGPNIQVAADFLCFFTT